MQAELLQAQVGFGVPILRFGGYPEKWTTKNLGKVAFMQRGFDLPSRDRCDGDVPIISSGGVSGFHNVAMTQAPGVVTGRYGSIGQVFFLETDFWPLNTSLWVKDFFGNDEKFIYYLLGRIDFEKFSDKTGVPGVNRNDLHQIQIGIPSLPEQEKIAAFLSAVDRKIQQLTRKKDLLEQYKKGVMQQLFAQEIRFKRDDGSAFPDWEETRLGELYTFFNTNSLSREKLNYEGGDVLNIHYGDIHTKFSSLFDVEKENVPYINEDVDLSKIADDCYCREGDLVIADASEDLDDIAKTIEIQSTGGRKILAGLHTYLARPKNGSIALGFGTYLMRSANVRYHISRLAHGTKVMSISRTHLNSIDLSLPSLEEQQKIATFLSALDGRVGAVQRQIAGAVRWKKGLLEGMFV